MGRIYNEDFAFSSDYLSPKIICDYYIKIIDTDSPILDVGAGTGLVGKFLNIECKKDIVGIDISSENAKTSKIPKNVIPP